MREGVLDGEEIMSAKATMSERRFRELYEVVPSDDSGNPFGVSAIIACIQEEMPEDRDVVVLGLDVGKMVDKSAMVGLNQFGEAVWVDHWRDTSWTHTIARVEHSVKRLGGPIVYADTTGVGSPIAEMLEERGVDVEGVTFSQKSKLELFDGLAADIQHGRVSYPQGDIVRELMGFRYEISPTGAIKYAGDPDDWVDALALANYGLRKGGIRVVGMFASEEEETLV